MRNRRGGSPANPEFICEIWYTAFCVASTFEWNGIEDEASNEGERLSLCGLLLFVRSLTICILNLLIFSRRVSNFDWKTFGERDRQREHSGRRITSSQVEHIPRDMSAVCGRDPTIHRNEKADAFRALRHIHRFYDFASRSIVVGFSYVRVYTPTPSDWFHSYIVLVNTDVLDRVGGMSELVVRSLRLSNKYCPSSKAFHSRIVVLTLSTLLLAHYIYMTGNSSFSFWLSCPIAED